MLTLIAHLRAKPAKREALLKILESFIEPTRNEADCITYRLHVSKDDPNHFMFYEVWRSQKSLDVHLSMPYLSSFWERRLEYLETDVELLSFDMLSSIESDTQ